MYGMLAGMWYFAPGSKSISDLSSGGFIPPNCSLKINIYEICDSFIMLIFSIYSPKSPPMTVILVFSNSLLEYIPSPSVHS